MNPMIPNPDEEARVVSLDRTEETGGSDSYRALIAGFLALRDNAVEKALVTLQSYITVRALEEGFRIGKKIDSPGLAKRASIFLRIGQQVAALEVAGVRPTEADVANIRAGRDPEMEYYLIIFLGREANGDPVKVTELFPSNRVLEILARERSEARTV